MLTPGLYLVATPIGNMKDITLRALEVLSNADKILCEDSRITDRLLSYHGIKKPLHVYHDFTKPGACEKYLGWLREGKALALVSDAGTPMISDPGYALVQAAYAESLPVHSIPGPCAAVVALTLAGLPTDRFLFEGFLPTKSAARKKALAPYVHLPASLIFYESPRRVGECLRDMQQVFGHRQAVVLRELTKTYETVYRGDLAELASYFAKEEVKGEVVIVVAPATEQEQADQQENIEAMLKEALATMRLREAVDHVVALTGQPKKHIYRLALTLSSPD